MENNKQDSQILKHHIQQSLCTTRPNYRQGRSLTAVKVYTINNESVHLLIFGVPKIKLRNELKTLCSKYGKVKLIHEVPDYKSEIFTECFHILYERIQSARIAKKTLDNRSFYGGVLHVCYGPEFETLADTRAKLEQRRKDVGYRLLKNEKEKQDFLELIKEDSSSCQIKDKNPAVENSSFENKIEKLSEEKSYESASTSKNFNNFSYPSQLINYFGGPKT